MASDSKSNARPLSPFTLGVYYRWQISSALSILHRATGVALSVGALVFVYWLASAAAGPESYARAQGILGSFLVQLLMIGWVWSLWYHFLNGIRHLGWDFGYGFTLPEMTTTGWGVVIGSAVLTVLTLGIAWIF